jgi:thiamine biosynthesis lipoprotein
VVERERVVMGTTLRIRVEAADRESALVATGAAFAEVERIGGLLSTWSDASAIAAIHRAAPGTPTRVVPELLGLLAAADLLVEATEHAFEPRVGALVDAWDLRGEGRTPDALELAHAIAASGEGSLTLDMLSGTATRHDSRAWLDTGGFGKGAALDAARAVLTAAGVRGAFLDFGGQAALMGPSADPVLLALAHPERRWEAACWIGLESGHSVATSGSSERFVVSGGRVLSHILDPRTGAPAPVWGSVAVVAENSLEADALSTALYVMGPDEGSRWLGDRDDIAVLFLETVEGSVHPRWNSAMERLLSFTGAGCVPAPSN